MADQIIPAKKRAHPESYGRKKKGANGNIPGFLFKVYEMLSVNRLRINLQ